MSKRVRVYRNLKHGRHTTPLYSVLKNGKVVRRVRQILLADVRFIVNEAGRQRVLKENRKNVHAFVEGVPVQSAFGIDRFTKRDLPVRVGYNPYEGSVFTRKTGAASGYSITSARVALINKNGISIAYGD